MAEAMAARQVQEELRKLGIESEVYIGPIEINRNGKTMRVPVEQAMSLFQDMVVINAELDTDPVETAGHEAFHVWAQTEAGRRFREVLADNLNWGSEPLKNRFKWLQERYSEAHMLEELDAYIAGELHAGTNEAELREILRDYDAVKAAWQALVEAQGGRA